MYFIRRVLHDWPDDIVVDILRNLAVSMSPRSRVVINEILMPEVGAGAEACAVDMAMLTLAGTERTAVQWESLLERAELRLEKIYSSPKTHFVSRLILSLIVFVLLRC